MERLTCDYCGLPFRAPRRPVADAKAYCCSGCAMASQLGIEGDRFPVTPQLIVGLLFAFGVFNQGLLGLLAVAMERDGRSGTAALCLLVSAVLALALYLGVLAWQARARWLRASDAFVFALVAGPVLAAPLLAWMTRGPLGAALGLAANLVLLGWQSRGFLRRWWSQRRRSATA